VRRADVRLFGQERVRLAGVGLQLVALVLVTRGDDPHPAPVARGRHTVLLVPDVDGRVDPKIFIRQSSYSRVE
jgi:hypothetical protein